MQIKKEDVEYYLKGDCKSKLYYAAPVLDIMKE